MRCMPRPSLRDWDLWSCRRYMNCYGRSIFKRQEPFHAPGGSLVLLAASAIIVGMLTTLEWRELIAAFAGPTAC